MSTDREAKLPKWARDNLEHLRRRLGEAEAALAAERGAVGPTHTYLRDYMRGDRPLPEHSIVLFHLGDEVTVEAVLKDGYVEVRSSGLRSSSLQVQPNAGNVIKVKPGEWW